MNKAKARIAKRVAGIGLSVLLLGHLWRQIRAGADSGAGFGGWSVSGAPYFWGAVLLLPLNFLIEARKWQMLAGSAMPLSLWGSLRSVLAGVAASLITPNRIGEYPGRILALGGAKSTRLISVSVLGACAQMLALMTAGVAGLCYYCALHPKLLYFGVLGITIAFTIALGTLYFSFERWAPRIERVRILRRLRLWGRLLHRFSRRDQIDILSISLLRLAVFSTQYWLLLRWRGIPLPLFEGLALCALFFWALATIPTIALAELGVRGEVSLFLFGTYSANAAGITAAVFLLWCINLVVPALGGVATILLDRRNGRAAKPPVISEGRNDI